MFRCVWFVLFLRALPAVLSLATAATALRNFAARVRRRGMSVSIANAVLLIEFAASLVLAVICALGLWFSSGALSQQANIFFGAMLPGVNLFSTVSMMVLWDQQRTSLTGKAPITSRQLLARPGGTIMAVSVCTIGIFDGLMLLLASYSIILAEDVRAVGILILFIVQLMAAAFFILTARAVEVDVLEVMLRSDQGVLLHPHLKRLGFWLAISGFCMICTIVGAFLSVHFWSLEVTALAGAAFAFGRLGTSFAQVHSLDFPTGSRRPLSPMNQNVASSVMPLSEQQQDPKPLSARSVSMASATVDAISCDPLPPDLTGSEDLNGCSDEAMRRALGNSHDGVCIALDLVSGTRVKEMANHDANTSRDSDAASARMVDVGVLMQQRDFSLDAISFRFTIRKTTLNRPGSNPAYFSVVFTKASESRLLAVVQGISELIRTEMALQAQEEQLREREREHERAMNQVRAFVHHDIGNALMGLGGVHAVIEAAKQRGELPAEGTMAQFEHLVDFGRDVLNSMVGISAVNGE